MAGSGMKNRLYILEVLLFIGQLTLPARSIQFQHLTTVQGLSDNTVLCICQDHKGFLWFGTQNGLNQYDGYQNHVFLYNPSQSGSISSDIIHCLLEDNQNRLWVGTENGLNRFQRNRNAFRRYRTDSGDTSSLIGDNIACLYKDREGTLWIGTYSGISIYQKETDSFRHLLPGTGVKAILQDLKGRYWFGTAFDGIYLYDPNLRFFKHFIHQPSKPLSLGSNRIEAISADTLGNIWIGTIDGGLNYFTEEKDGFISYKSNPSDPESPASNTVYTLYLDEEGTLWAGFENAGLYRIQVTPAGARSVPHVTFKVFNHDINDIQSLSNNTVRAIFQDEEKNLWVGTYYGGVNCSIREKKPFINFHTEPFHAQGLGHDVVQDLWEDSRGNIWIGTDGGGLNRFDRKTGSFKKYIHIPDNPHSLCDDHVLSLSQDHSGRLWLATWNGLCYFDIQNERFITYLHDENDPKSLSSDKVTCVFTDSRNQLWIGTASGLNLFDEISRTFRHFGEESQHSLSSRYIHAIYQDRSQNIWIATVHGLYELNRENWARRNYDFLYYVHDEEDSTSIPESHVLTVFEDNRGLIWCGTLKGLCSFDPVKGHFALFGMQQGLSSNSVYSIIEDGKRCLWIGTGKGISRFDPEIQQFTNYGIHDGLYGDAFNKAVLRSSNGELLFGGKTGFTIFNPDSIRQSKYIPPVVLTDFKIFNRSIPLSQVLRIPGDEAEDSLFLELYYNQNMISFEFASLDFTAPDKNKYRYKMEGFDDEWRETGADRRFATYTNLSAGHYVFRVQGSNSDGIWNEEGVSVMLKINPPFWKTPWAFLIYTILFSSILLTLRELIVYREKLKHELLMERKEAERVHQVDEMKLRFFTNVSHEFRTPLTLILGLLERLMHSKRSLKRSDLFQNFLIMQRNAARLLRLINQIMDIRKLDQGRLHLDLKYYDIVGFIRSIYSSFKYQAEERGMQYQFTSSADEFFMYFDSDKVEKIIYNILSNAFKFTRDNGSISIQIHVPRAFEISIESNLKQAVREIEVRILDNGLGISEEYQEKIFDPFFQVQHEGEPSSKGTGIGLSLTRELVALHQGSVTVFSRKDEGSCFTVRLPATLVPKTGEAVSKTQSDLEPFYEESLHPVSPHVSVKSYNPAAPLILIVDDDADLCHYLRDELDGEYRVLTANNGGSAFQKAVESMPDLIISDVRMPEIDGFTLCAQLKQNQRTSHVPIIMLTSQPSDEARIDGYDMGADDYIVKPFDIHLLRKRIANLLQSRKNLKERFSHEIYLQPNNIVITPEEERFLKNVLRIMDEHIEDTDFNVSQLGREIGLSRVQLYRKLKLITRMNPNDLIRDFRLKRAAQLLEESHLTVFEIAYRVGFKDPSYFCKCFKQQYHVPPSEYARIHFSTHSASLEDERTAVTDPVTRHVT
jgi:ligand-binding sensor domain-containing protein/signal transduction histidine kinase/DNA-binding response OmpR family regulator